METSNPDKTLFAFGLNHKTAPVDVRERLYLHPAEVPALLAKYKQVLSECFILSTCNRTEIYGVTDSSNVEIDRYMQILIDFKGAGDIVADDHFFTYVSCVATKHLFSVVSSIDSKVIGDSQIMRQVRNAYSVAQQNDCTGKIINQLLQRAFRVGKRASTETAIRGGAVSVSLAAVKLAFETLGTLDGATVMILGAGETAKLTAEALINKHVGKILVANRSRDRAEQLLEDLGSGNTFIGEIVPFERFKERLAEVDIVISSTGASEPILTRPDLEGIGRRMLIVDIAVPRDIEHSIRSIPGITLKNIDDLNSILDGDHQKRLDDIPKVKQMIGEEMDDFLTWYYSLPLMPECSRNGMAPSADQRNEILRVKNFLDQHMSEIHKLRIVGTGAFSDDLRRHFQLIKGLRSEMRRQCMAAAA
jgi:glutamyl-tRNA reductase